MFKTLLTIVFTCIAACSLRAQTYRNEWIDYSKTYYKFKVGPFGYDIVNAPIKKGIVRIGQPALSAAGLSSVPAENFQLWRNGEEVAIYVSQPTGTLGPDGYIEFWGEINDGKPDKDLYRSQANQLSDYWSLETDSSAYFLTNNTAGNNKRYTNVINDVSAAAIQPDKNFMYTRGRYFRFAINPGFGIKDVQNLYSSTYDIGEGWTSRPVRPNSCGTQPQLPQFFPSLYADTTGPSMTAHLVMLGNILYPRNVKVLFNDDSLTQFSMDYFSTANLTVPNIPAGKITFQDSALFVVQNLSDGSCDEMEIPTIELTYPRRFNFGGNFDFEFNLAASDTGRYIKIVNFSSNGVAPVLYDMTNGFRYIADISIPDTIRFLLQPSSEAYHLVLARGDGSAATGITAFESRNFVDFSQNSNQGNYLIISNPLIYGSGSENYVEQYRAYRSSAAGGGYNAKIFNIHELEDQFAYGIDMHPLAVKNFLKYARNIFSASPAYTFLIGKGVIYSAYRPYSNNATYEPYMRSLNLVPTYGSPGSDNLLGSDNYDAVPATPVGRLAAISAQEVGNYLSKVKEYEIAQKDSTQTIAAKGWMKKVLQLTGANDAQLGIQLDTITAKYTRIISDTLFGGDVTTFSKTTDPGAYPQQVVNFKNIFDQGSALVEYFGHSSSTEIDFSLDDASRYDNAGKYPFFIVNGCLAGNIFDFDLNRTNLRTSLSDRFVFEPQRGAIAYLSSCNYGVLNYLDIFTEQFYKSITSSSYGKGLGNITGDGLNKGLSITSFTDFYGRMHAEQFTLHGDPAIKMNSYSLPDYAIDSNQIEISPDFISVADDSFNVKIRIYNLGKATNDSVHFSLFRKSPGGDSAVAFSTELPYIKTVDSFVVRLPVVGNRDNGTVTLTGYVDDDKKIPEISEANNIASRSFKITSDEIRPVFPYNYAIISAGAINLSASTADALDTNKQYIAEIDTTALFNSSLKITRTRSSTGGLVDFGSISLSLDNTVYYWRVAPDAPAPHWNMFSFIHKSIGNPGFEQAHFYQHTQSSLDKIMLDSSSRQYQFTPSLANLYVLQSIYPTSGSEDNQFSISVNGSFVTQSACVGSSILFSIFDPLSFKPVANITNPYGAAGVCKPSTLYSFEYSTQDAASRKNAMDFLDNFVPDGYFVVARKIYDQGNADWAPTIWAADTALYGSGNSLYHRLKDQGTLIDSFTYPRTFVFVFKKNDSAHYKPLSLLSAGLYDRISLSENMSVTDTLAHIISPKFGPGKAWNRAAWTGFELNSNNIASLDIIGIDKNGIDSVFFTLDKTQPELDISAIDAKTYPYIQFRMKNQDSVTGKPYQLEDWLVEYSPSPEGAIAPNLGIDIPDTVRFDHDVNVEFDTLQGYVVFKNISTQNFSPLKTKLVLYDDNYIAHAFTLPRTAALAAGDTLHISFLVNITSIPQGRYNLYLEVNPDDDQAEQYHFNNFLYKYVYVDRGQILPVHLLNFTAEAYHSSVILNWSAADEINFSHYEVEHSPDARSFKFIGSVPAIKENISVKEYSFLHTNPVNSKNYYRLKLVDNDGKFLYSPIRLVTFGKEAIIITYPNPFYNRLNISVNQNANINYTVRLYNIAGQLILQRAFGGNISLDVSKLAVGTYIVQVDNGHTVQSFKMQKQKQ